MKFLLFATLLALASAVSAQDVDESDVIVGTADNFDALLKDNQFVLAEFYAPWCGHCKKLVAPYAAAATALQGKAVLVKVDATVETDLASKFNVRGYPTLKWFNNGEASDYGGGRDEAGIVSWVTKKSGPPSQQLESAAAVADFVKDKLAVVGTFKSRDSDAYKTFVATASKGSLDAFQFADVAGDADSITLYTKHAEPQVVTGDDLEKFVLTNGFPLVDELPAAWERYQAKGNPLAILFIDPAADNAATLKIVEEAAGKVADKFSFSFADGVRFAQQIERMGASKELPSVAAMKLNGKSNFPYSGKIEAEALAAWGASIADGSLAPVLKSEEVPAEQKNLFKLVGKEFEKIAYDATKDVLVEIYAPWCGHCKTLQPEIEGLAEDFASDSNVIIAQLDGTANDLTDVEYRGFPTIKFFPAAEGGKDTMQDFEGGRTRADMKAFIEKNRKSSPAAAEGHTEL